MSKQVLVILLFLYLNTAENETLAETNGLENMAQDDILVAGLESETVEATEQVTQIKKIQENLRCINTVSEWVSIFNCLSKCIKPTSLMEEKTSGTGSHVRCDISNLNPISKPSSTVEVENCADIKRYNKVASSGIYKVHPRTWSIPIEVYCDMETLGGGWTVFQRRIDVPNNLEYFHRNWTEYKQGFGDLNKEFWIGNDKLNALTRSSINDLRVELEDFEKNKRYAHYEGFQVADEMKGYQLAIDKYSGDSGDDLSNGKNEQFVTFDRDNASKCGVTYKGGWWYNSCHHWNLNGLYLRGNHTSYADGVDAYSFNGYHYSLKFTEMKFRPKTFS